jgi:hypothetical protein
MNTRILATAAALSDNGLLARLDDLAGREREASVELVAHLAELDTRPAVYATAGYGSLFAYCTQALRLSEDAACNRIEAARACRRFPVILDHLASGAMTLTAVRLLGRHLTEGNHALVLEKAMGRCRREIEVLVAELAPQPDAPSLVRRLPPAPPGPEFAPEAGVVFSRPASTIARPPAPLTPGPRPIVQPTAPERYRVQFTIGPSTHDKLRRVQALLRREIPDGDPGAIFDRALSLLLDQAENRKLGLTASPRAACAIRPRTDTGIRTPPRPSRGVPRDVRREVWRRDGGQCAFVTPSGRRCTEREFLEFHHVEPYARQGPATVANISLLCRGHNQYESEVIFGPRRSRLEERLLRADGPLPP